jgi:hypothetical protein
MDTPAGHWPDQIGIAQISEAANWWQTSFLKG